MVPPVTSIPSLFEFLGVLGKTIRTLLSQSKDVKVSGKGRVTVMIVLGPHLESVIRELLAKEGRHEEPSAYWSQATQQLISHDEEKFRVLSRLDINDTTIGTEAIIQRADAVPESMTKVTLAYVEQFVLAPANDDASPWQLPAPSLAHTLQTAIRRASDESPTPLMDQLGMPRARPQFSRGEDTR